MTEWKKGPYSVYGKAGESKALCQCHKSSDAPYCDGSHRDTEFKPTIYKFIESEELIVCGCGKSKSMPFCDGAHNAKD